jgi:integrase
MHPTLLDAAGHQRAAVTLPGYHAGRPPRNKGRRYPADPPTVEEIIAVMRTAGAGPDGARLRALIVVLWRAGLRISEALALTESDMDARRGAVLVRHAKGNKRREVGMDTWAWEQLEPWQQLRTSFPVGAFFCVIYGPTAGRKLGTVLRSPTTRAHLRRGRGATPVRAASTPARARGRDGSRGCPARRHPAAIGRCEPRGHLDLPPSNRQLRNLRHRPRTTPADDPRHRRFAHDAVITAPSSTSPRIAPLPGFAAEP